MGAYRLVIGCNLNQYETNSFEPNMYLALDVQGDKSIKSSSTIASQPMQNGDTMSDHMYRNPNTFSVSGSFSLDGKQFDDDSYNLFGSGDRLENVETMFETIKDNGILCTLITMDEDDDGKHRFKIRKNMALREIAWVELYNSVKFDFQFYEVILVNQQEYYNLPEEERQYLSLPDVNYPTGSSLGQVLQDNTILDEMIIRSLNENEYLDPDFIKEVNKQTWKDVGLAYLAFVISAASVAIATGVVMGVTSAAIAAGTAATVFPIGTIVAIAAVAVAAGVLFIRKAIRDGKKKRKAKKMFKLVNGSAEPDLIRLKELIDNVKNELNKLETKLSFYQISANKPQQVIIKIDGVAFILEMVKNSSTNEWSYKVTRADGKEVDIVHQFCVCQTLEELIPQNSWFRYEDTHGGIYTCYILNASTNDMLNPSEEAQENVADNLTSYTIVVCEGDVQNELKIIQTVIADTLINEGFV